MYQNLHPTEALLAMAPVQDRESWSSQNITTMLILEIRLVVKTNFPFEVSWYFHASFSLLLLSAPAFLSNFSIQIASEILTLFVPQKVFIASKKHRVVITIFYTAVLLRRVFMHDRSEDYPRGLSQARWQKQLSTDSLLSCLYAIPSLYSIGQLLEYCTWIGFPWETLCPPSAATVFIRGVNVAGKGPHPAIVLSRT